MQRSREINQKYGLDSSGSPKYIRSADGLLVENSATAREEIRRTIEHTN